MSNPTSNLRGIAYMVLATLVLMANDTLVKLSTDGLPPFQVLFVRGVFSAFWLVVVLTATGTLSKARRALDKRVLLRGSMEMLAVLCYILALTNMSIADMTALFQLAPILLMLIVGVVFRERIGPLRWILIGIGFAGALLVAQPGGAGFTIYSVIGFLGAGFTAMRDVIGRRVANDVPGPVAASAVLMLVMIVAGIIHVLLEAWVMPSAQQFLMLGAAALFLTIAQIFMFLAYRHGDTSTVAPFYYTLLLWSIVSGLVVFGVVPNALALIGMALILIAGFISGFVSERRKPLPLT